MIKIMKKFLTHPILIVPVALFLLWGLFQFIFIIGPNSIIYMDAFWGWLSDALNNPTILGNIL